MKTNCPRSLGINLSLPSVASLIFHPCLIPGKSIKRNFAWLMKNNNCISVQKSKNFECQPHQISPTSFSSSFRYRSVHLLQILHGHCSQKIRDIFPVPLRHVSNTRSLTGSYPFRVALPNLLTLSHKSSLIPQTCNL